MQFLTPKWFEENYWVNYTPIDVAIEFDVSVRKVICRANFLRKVGYNIRKKPEKHAFCIRCKKEISKYNTFLCRNCSAKIRYKNRGNYISNGKSIQWTKSEVDFIKKNYATMTSKDISLNLNKSVSSIYHKAKKLGLKKDFNFYMETLKKTGCLFSSNNNPMHNPKYHLKAVKNIQKYYHKNPEKRLNVLLRRDRKTNPEIKMEVMLKEIGVDFVWNQYIKTEKGYKFPDFRVLDSNLIIEVDGEYWHNKRKVEDKIRQEELELSGYKIIRFTDKQILNNPDEVRECLRQELIQLEN